VTFRSLVGRTYRVQRAENLEAPDWVPVSGILQAENPVTTWSGPVTSGSDRSFYRVVQLD
jgi:hypothetical protein